MPPSHLHQTLCSWGTDTNTGHRGPFPTYLGAIQRAINSAALIEEAGHDTAQLQADLWSQLEDVLSYTDPYSEADNADEFILLELARSLPTSKGPAIDYAATKDAVDIVDYVLRHTKLKLRRNVWVGRCPLPGHHDRTASFYVYPATRSWFCYGACHKGGDIFDFWTAMTEGKPYPDELTR